MSKEAREAAERIVNAQRYWTGTVPFGPGYLDIDESDVMCVAGRYLELESDLEKLRVYLKHKGNCPSSAQMWARMESGTCDCGLDSILEQLGIDGKQ